MEAVNNLLLQGYKLATHDLYNTFISPYLFLPNKIQPAVVDLLAKYNALPEDVSASTIKLILFLNANPYIKTRDFLDKPDLNLHACPGLLSPMNFATHEVNLPMIDYLIKHGVNERPIFDLSLGINESYGSLNLLKVEQFKRNLLNIFDSRVSPFKYLKQQCQAAEMFILNDTPALYDEIVNQLNDQNVQNRKFSLLAFFAWAAMGNRTDLLKTNAFNSLFLSYPEAAAKSIEIAAAFGSNQYVLDAINKVDTQTLGRILLSLQRHLIMIYFWVYRGHAMMH